MAHRALARIVPVLPVKDLVRSMDFYRRLGFSAHSWQGGDNYGFLTRDGLEIHLTQSEVIIQNQNPCGVYVYLADNSAAALETEFLAAGISLAERLAPREWNMNEFALRDPDGNQLVFGEGL
jgi:catechol 2,3-dioxygenase-like lactoylglutathione lyase family enzyme